MKYFNREVFLSIEVLSNHEASMTMSVDNFNISTILDKVFNNHKIT